MGVRTTADEKLDSAAEHIRQAIKDLAECAVEGCWGWDLYGSDYRETTREILFQLMQMKEKLSRD